jgi:hypothetical protein
MDRFVLRTNRDLPLENKSNPLRPSRLVNHVPVDALA